MTADLPVEHTDLTPKPSVRLITGSLMVFTTDDQAIRYAEKRPDQVEDLNLEG